MEQKSTQVPDHLAVHAPGEQTRVAIKTIALLVGSGAGVRAVTEMTRGLHPRAKEAFVKGVLDGCTDDYDEFVRTLDNTQLTKLLIACLMFAQVRLSPLQFSVAVGYPRPAWYKDKPDG